eukprot:tig00000411_g560.t1
MRSSSLATARAVAVLLASCAVAQACSCIGPITITSSYYGASHVFRAEIVSAERSENPGDLAFNARVLEQYKGWAAPRNVLVTTASNSAACGVNLEVGREYALFAFEPTSAELEAGAASAATSTPMFSVNLCSFNLPFASVSDCGLEYLRSRSFCNGTAAECGSSANSEECTAPNCPSTCAVLPFASCGFADTCMCAFGANTDFDCMILAIDL